MAATRGSFRYNPLPSGETQLQRYGAAADGEERWFDVDESMLEGRTMGGGKTSHPNKRNRVAENSQRRAREEARKLHTQGQAAVLRDQEAKDMDFLDTNITWPVSFPSEKEGFLERLTDFSGGPQNNMAVPEITGKGPIIAGQTTDKLVAGATDLKNTLQDIRSAVSPYQEPIPELANNDLFSSIGTVMEDVIGSDIGALDRQRELAAEQAEKDKYYEQMKDNEGLSKIAAIPPYMVSQVALPPLSRAAGATIKTALNTVDQGARKAGGYVGDIIRKQAAEGGDNVVTGLAKEIDDAVLAPLTRRSIARGNQPKLSHETRSGFGGQLGGSAALGAIEGGIHYDDSMLDGVYASLLGTGMGKMYEPFLSRAATKLGTAEKEVLKWAESKGYRPTPGLKLGQPKYQSKEAGLRSDERYSGPMKQLDDANDEVVTRVAGETMGLSDAQMKNLTPETLAAHKKSLSDEYKAITDASSGKIKYSDLTAVERQLDELPSTKVNDDIRKEVAGWVDRIKTLNTPKRDARGRYAPASFDGKQYQSIRQELKAKITKAYDDGNPTYGKSLTSLVEALDKGMSEGVARGQGTATAALWKDLNERFAMTELVMNNGMNPLGGINLNRLSNYFMEHDANRILTGQGGRVKDLHNLVKLNHMNKNQQGSSLSGPGIEHITKEGKSESARLLNTPSSLDTSLPRWLKIRAYQSGYPASSGLLGLSREGNYSAPNLMRMIEQGTGLHPDAYESAVQAPGKAWDATKNWTQEFLQELLPKDFEQKEGEVTLDDIIQK